MMGMTDEQVLEFNRNIIAEFRANRGVCGGPFEGNDLLLLTMTGAKSGLQRTTPLTYHRYGDDYVVMASAGGHPTHPKWYHNLVSDPAVTIEVGVESFAGSAVLTEGEDRRAAFETMVASMPRFGAYQAAVDREIPVFRLVRDR